MKRERIINKLSKFWISRGVWFGDLIHKLKPKTIDDWNNYLKDHKYFFIKNMNFKKYERNYWIHYLKYSFWKLYQSETIAINYFKNVGINLQFADHNLDVKHSIDFWFMLNNKVIYLIVKDKLTKFEFTKIKTPNTYLFDSSSLIIYNSSGFIVSVTHLLSH